MGKEFSFENDPNMVWKGEPPKPTICSKCVNKMDNGKCESKDHAGLMEALRTDECDAFIEI